MWIVRIGTILRMFGRNGLTLLFALRHPQTPGAIKLGIIALIAYTVSPLDLIPDFAALLGWADDLALLGIGIPFLIRRLPADVQRDVEAKTDRWLGRFGMGGGTGRARSNDVEDIQPVQPVEPADASKPAGSTRR